RWAAALRALVPGLAGMSGMPQGRFTAANISGGAIWAMAVAVVGYAAGASLTVLAKRLGLAGEVLLAAAVVALVVGLFISRRRRTAQNQAPLDPMSHDGQTQSSSDE
ncbi:MAG TPA: DedA family protein, partial [Nocardioidaceae bacterium]|nr:DedA family protein [Nocardioidaceae bacterium]